MRIRYRPFQALAIGALAALITACAVFAPLYDRAMHQAIAGISLAQEPGSVVGLGVSAVSDVGSSYYGSDHSTDPPPAPELVLDTLPPTVVASYGTPIMGYEAAVIPEPAGAEEPTGQLIWREGQCDHVTFVEGACPAGPAEVAISAADARIFDYRVGSTFEVAGVPTGRAGAVTSTPMTVTGVYRQLPGDYWFDLDLTGRSGTLNQDPSPHVQHDVWLTDRTTFSSPDLPLLPAESSSVDLPLDVGATGVDEVLALADRVEALDGGRGLERPGADFTVSTGLPDIADNVRTQIKQSRVTVPLLMAQLGLLAVFVLWLVLLAVTEQRRPEVALARLRGRGRRGARRLLLGELLPVALGGVIPGVLLAILGSWVARTVVLPGDAPFELGLRVLAAVALAVGLLTVVTVVAVSRVAREPVETLLRRVPPRRTTWALGVADAVMIAGAGAIVVVFATGGLDGPVALAAPGLIAVVVGLVLAHLTSPTAAVLGRRLLRRGRVGAGVSVLDAARSPATRRVVAIVTLASALAVFSADALVVGARNRASAAEQQAGAPMVVDVAGTDLTAVRAALEKVDPDGTSVTPVVRIRPPAGSGDTLAVLPEGFRRIALFPGGAAPASEWDRLRVPDAEPIRLTGSSIDVDAVDSTLTSIRIDGQAHPVTLGLDLVTASGSELRVTLGELDRGTDRAHFAHDVSCQDGCFLTAVWLSTLPGATIKGRVTLRDLTTTPGGDVVPLGPASLWTPYVDPAKGSMRPSSSADDELTVTVRSNGSTEISMLQSWLPTQAAALVSGTVPDGDSFDAVGLDGEDQAALRVGVLPRVPASRLGTRVLNLDVIERGRSVAPNAGIELWFADDDPDLLAEVTEALTDEGIAVSSTSTLAEVRRGYDESAAAWSLQLAALVGAAALLIALLVLVVSAVSSWRFRTRDLAALRMGGVPGRSLTVMAVAAQLPAVVIGIVAGAAAGLAGAQLALPIVPLFATAPEVSTLDLDTAWVAVIVATLAALVVLGVGSVLIGRTLARRSDVRRLRETL